MAKYVNVQAKVVNGHVLVVQDPAPVNDKPNTLAVGRYLVFDADGKQVKEIKRDDKGKATLQSFVESLVPKEEDPLAVLDEPKPPVADPKSKSSKATNTSEGDTGTGAKSST